jgi:hypothetical protein
MYSRAACGLCDEAREVLMAARSDHGFEFEEVLIDGREDLERHYGVRVPVVLVDGEEEFELHVDRDRLRAVLAAARD